MRFSQLLSHLSEVQAAGGTQSLSHHLAEDPELRGAAALDQAGQGEL
ncbi:MAG: UDP-3-O-(3-hydroxymyristoyl)glucosamine N-acyltransferase, partial [Cyanobacteriota bacterium]